MKFKRLWAQVLKELAQFRRDKLTLALAFVLPVLSFFVFGYGVRLEEKDIPITIQDFDNSPLSREYTDRFFSNIQFRRVAFSGSDPVKGAVDSGKAQAAIIIPPEFSRKFKAGHASPVEVLIDGTDVNNARVIKNSILATTLFFQDTLKYGNSASLIDPEVRIWFNPGRKEPLYVVPGAIGVILWIYPSLLAALAMVREKEQGTILQAYASSISAFELLGGKAVAYWFIGMCEMVVVMVMAYLCFGLWFVVEPTSFIVGTVIFVLDSVLFGLMIGTGVATQQAAVQAVAFAGFTTALLLSGVLYPLRNIRFPFDLVSLIVPARYYLIVSRDAFVRGSGWLGVGIFPLILCLFGLFYARICYKRMGKMQMKS
jgi:ABC-2 type transport system permease protein